LLCALSPLRVVWERPEHASERSRAPVGAAHSEETTTAGGRRRRDRRRQYGPFTFGGAGCAKARLEADNASDGGGGAASAADAQPAASGGANSGPATAAAGDGNATASAAAAIATPAAKGQRVVRNPLPQRGSPEDPTSRPAADKGKKTRKQAPAADDARKPPERKPPERKAANALTKMWLGSRVREYRTL
jgi:hypothetical protein